MPQPHVVFVNIGWMIDYNGLSADDPIVGGHGHFKTHAFGHEAWNFQPYRGKIYGYVPRTARINLSNLGGKKADPAVENVTVIWIARDPRDRKTYIVGWYLSATVYTQSDHVKLSRRGGHEVWYQIEAQADNAVLLPPDRRLFHVPTAKVKGNLGQSPVWYGGTDAFRMGALAYVQAGGVFPKAQQAAKGAPKQLDPEARKRIELAAVRHATAYYQSVEGGGRTVESVEKDGVGWDLTVTAPTGAVLKVEVKGLSGSTVVVELTPNEYKKMMSAEHRKEYVVYIVTEADTDRAKSHVFIFNSEISKNKRLVWESQDGRKLRVEEVVAARLSAI